MLACRGHQQVASWLAHSPSPPFPTSSPRGGGAGTRRMRSRPKADVCIAAGRTLKSPRGARGILAELERRRAGGNRGGLDWLTGTAAVTALRASLSGGLPEWRGQALRKLRVYPQTHAPFEALAEPLAPCEGSSFSTKHVSKKAALGRAPGPRFRAQTPSFPLFLGVDKPISSPSLNYSPEEGRGV